MLSALRLHRPALLATALLGLAAAAPAPAPAAEHVDVYDAYFEAEVNHNRAEHDTATIPGAVWDRLASMQTHVRTRARGIEIVDGGVGRRIARPVDAVSFTGTDAMDRITITTDGPDTTDCVESGTPRGTPGSVEIAGEFVGPDGPSVLGVYRPVDPIEVPLKCSGFSSAEGFMLFSNKPLEARFSISKYAIGQPRIETYVSGELPCPAAQFTRTCASTYHGKVVLERTASYDRPSKGEKPPRRPATAPAPPKGGGGLSSEEADAILDTIYAVSGLRRAKVTVRCEDACKGKLSAYAVARSKTERKTTKPKLAGKGKLRSPDGGGKATATVRFSASGARAVKRRGAVELRVQVRPAGGGPVERQRVVAKVKR